MRPRLLVGAALGVGAAGRTRPIFEKALRPRLRSDTNSEKQAPQKMSKPRDFQSEGPASGNYKFEIVEEGILVGTNGKSIENGQNATLVVTLRLGPAEMARS